MIAPEVAARMIRQVPGNNQIDVGQKIALWSERCLPASRLGQGRSSGFPYRSGLCNAASDGQSHAGTNAATRDVPEVCPKLVSM